MHKRRAVGDREGPTTRCVALLVVPPEEEGRSAPRPVEVPCAVFRSVPGRDDPVVVLPGPPSPRRWTRYAAEWAATGRDGTSDKLYVAFALPQEDRMAAAVAHVVCETDGEAWTLCHDIRLRSDEPRECSVVEDEDAEDRWVLCGWRHERDPVLGSGVGLGPDVAHTGAVACVTRVADEKLGTRNITAYALHLPGSGSKIRYDAGDMLLARGAAAGSIATPLHVVVELRSGDVDAAVAALRSARGPGDALRLTGAPVPRCWNATPRGADAVCDPAGAPAAAISERSLESARFSDFAFIAGDDSGGTVPAQRALLYCSNVALGRLAADPAREAYRCAGASLHAVSTVVDLVCLGGVLSHATGARWLGLSNQTEDTAASVATALALARWCGVSDALLPWVVRWCAATATASTHAAAGALLRAAAGRDAALATAATAPLVPFSLRAALHPGSRRPPSRVVADALNDIALMTRDALTQRVHYVEYNVPERAKAWIDETAAARGTSARALVADTDADTRTELALRLGSEIAIDWLAEALDALEENRAERVLASTFGARGPPLAVTKIGFDMTAQCDGFVQTPRSRGERTVPRANAAPMDVDSSTPPGFWDVGFP